MGREWIENDCLKVGINTVGAVMFSLQDSAGKEYLWQGDEAVWKNQDVEIFPYIARLTEGKYTFQGKTYSMGRHGILVGRELQVADQKKDRLTLRLRSDDDTRRSYPFEFVYEITFLLVDNHLKVQYHIQNLCDTPMYFAVGGHPGFQVPIDKMLDFTDYYLQFEDGVVPKQVGFTPQCFLDGTLREYPLDSKNRIALHHGLFDDDAIVLLDAGSSVELGSDRDHHKIRVVFPDMKYVGFWHMPRLEAPYVCIEPWSSLPSRQDIIEDFEKQENLLSLEGRGEYHNEWSIEIF